MKGTSQRRPPRLASKIFDWYCSSASVDDLRGDMDELFYLDVERMSVARARIRATLVDKERDRAVGCAERAGAVEEEIVAREDEDAAVGRR